MEEEVGPGHLGSGLPGQEMLGACHPPRGTGSLDWAWVSLGEPLSQGPPICGRRLTCLSARVSVALARCQATRLPGDPGRRPLGSFPHTGRPPRRRERPQARAGCKVGLVLFSGVTVGEQRRAQLCS